MVFDRNESQGDFVALSWAGCQGRSERRCRNERGRARIPGTVGQELSHVVTLSGRSAARRIADLTQKWLWLTEALLCSRSWWLIRGQQQDERAESESP